MNMEFLKRIVFKNLGLKLASIALASFIWMTLTNDQPIEKAISVHLEYRNIPPGLEIAGPLVSLIEVHIKTAGKRRTISETEFAAFVDLRDATEGDKSIHLSRNNIISPAGIEILKINPPRVALILDRTLTKTIRIIPSLEGSPAPGYEISQTLISPPSSITIEGPRNRMEKIQSAKTEKISIEGRNSDLLSTINVDIEDPYIRILDIRPVQVKVQIKEKRKDVVVNGVPITLSPLNSGLSFHPEKLDVTLSVPASFASVISPANLRARLKIDGIAIKHPTKVKPVVDYEDPKITELRVVSVVPNEIEVKPISKSARQRVKPER